MEITVNIPRNTYKVPTEVRPEVVQAICEAFLFSCCYSIFHPHDDGRRKAKDCVWLKNDKGVGFGDESQYYIGEKHYHINGCDMVAAFDALRSAGYHIFRVYMSGWMGYKVEVKPYCRYWDRECKEVFSFDDFID